jgi:uncharacterized membrane protein YfcA
MTADYINGIYEFLAGIVILLSIIKLAKEKQVRGIHWLQVFFFTSWGYWNLYYYFSLQQYASWLCGLSVCAANSVWCIMIVYYYRQNEKP